MKNLCGLFVALCGFFAFGVPALAHDAHVHGVVHLDVVVEGKTVEIELVSPLANIISFEHAPETDTQKQEVRDMAAVMRKADSLFVLPAQAECRLEKVSLESGVIEDDLLFPSGSGHTENAHGKREGHAHDDHEDGHSNLEAEIVFLCGHPEKLSDMRVDLFRVFPNLREVEVRMVTPAGQKAAELTSEDNVIRWQ
jgi:hypothetical protein